MGDHDVLPAPARDQATRPAVPPVTAPRPGEAANLGRPGGHDLSQVPVNDTTTTLAPGERFRWIGSPMSPSVVISIRWLADSGVRPGTLDVEGGRFPQVLGPIVEGLTAYCTWIDRARATAAVDKFTITMGENAWAGTETVSPLRSTVFQLGLPMDAPIQVVRRGAGVRVYADLAQLHPAPPTWGVTVDTGRPEIARRIVEALEGDFPHPVTPALRGRFLDHVESGLPATPEVYALDLTAEDLAELFGEAEFRAFAASAVAGPEQAGPLVRLPGAVLEAPADADEADLAVIRKLGGSPGLRPPPPADGRSVLSHADVKALLELDQAEDRDAVLAALKSGTGPADERASIADQIAAARARLDWTAAAQSLQRTDPAGGEERPKPIVPRPVHGVIRNPDRLVPGLEAHFTFETTDAVDALRVPLVDIRWMARKAPDGPILEEDRTSYVEVRPHGALNERIFEVTFAATGRYEIHAFVDHNFYLPAHFTTEVEVVTEQSVLAEFRAAGQADWGTEDASAPQRFAEIAADEKLFTDMFSGGRPELMGDASEPLPETEYTVGTRATGTLSPKVAERAGQARADRITALTAELDRLDELTAAYRKQGMRDDDTVLESITDRRKRVADAIKQLEDLPAGDRVVPTRAYYASRTHGVPSSPLSLVVHFAADGRKYRGHLLDQTELTESAHYDIDRDAGSFEALMEALFVELSQAYPNGAVSFAYQVWDPAGQTFTDKFVRLERVTDTLSQDVSDVVFAPATSMAVNLTALLLTLFPPTAAIGITLGLAYNAAQTVADMHERARLGVLDSGEVSVQLLQLTLDVVPVVGKATKIIRIGTKAYRVIEGVQLAANGYLLTEDADRAIQTLRDTKIAELLTIRDEIGKLAAVNASDPKLTPLRRREQEALSDIRSSTADTYATLIRQQAIMLGSITIIRHLAEPVLAGRRDVDVDVDVDEKPDRNRRKETETETGKKETETKPDETKPAETKPDETKPDETKPAAKQPAGTGPKLPAGVETGRLRRRAMDLIGELSPEDQALVLEYLKGQGPKRAGKSLSNLGGRDDAQARTALEALVEMLRRRQGTDGPAPTGSSLDPDADGGFDPDEHPTRTVENRPEPRVSPDQVGVNRNVVKNRMIRAGLDPFWATSGRDWNPHHLIPVELIRHPIFDVLRNNGGWDHHGLHNLMALPTRVGLVDGLPIHQVDARFYRDTKRPMPDVDTMTQLRGHPQWNSRVRTDLDNLRPLMNDPDRLRTAVHSLQDKLRQHLENLGSAENPQVLL